MSSAIPAMSNGPLLAAAFAAFPALYFLTPRIPALGTGVLAGALAVTLFAFLFIDAAVGRLHGRKIPSLILACCLAVSALGVWGLNLSLYNFKETPALSESTYFVERADEVLFVEKTGEGEGEYRVLAGVPKRFWLVKTFAINVLLLTLAVTGGTALGALVEKASHIFAIIFMGAAMDLWSVSSGVTERIAATPYGSYHFLLNWPLAGKGGVTYPLIGSTDFLFVTLFLSLARKFDLDSRRNLIAMATAVILSILSALLLGVGVPALPFIGAAVLAVNFNAILPGRKEFLQIIAGTAVMVLVMVALKTFLSSGR